jgi:hypothetical protein
MAVISTWLLKHHHGSISTLDREFHTTLVFLSARKSANLDGTKDQHWQTLKSSVEFAYSKQKSTTENNPKDWCLSGIEKRPVDLPKTTVKAPTIDPPKPWVKPARFANKPRSKSIVPEQINFPSTLTQLVASFSPETLEIYLSKARSQYGNQNLRKFSISFSLGDEDVITDTRIEYGNNLSSRGKRVLIEIYKTHHGKFVIGRMHGHYRESAKKIVKAKTHAQTEVFPEFIFHRTKWNTISVTENELRTLTSNQLEYLTHSVYDYDPGKKHQTVVLSIGTCSDPARRVISFNHSEVKLTSSRKAHWIKIVIGFDNSKRFKPEIAGTKGKGKGLSPKRTYNPLENLINSSAFDDSISRKLFGIREEWIRGGASNVSNLKGITPRELKLLLEYQKRISGQPQRKEVEIAFLLKRGKVKDINLNPNEEVLDKKYEKITLVNEGNKFEVVEGINLSKTLKSIFNDYITPRTKYKAYEPKAVSTPPEKIEPIERLSSKPRSSLPGLSTYPKKKPRGRGRGRSGEGGFLALPIRAPKLRHSIPDDVADRLRAYPLDQQETLIEAINKLGDSIKASLGEVARLIDFNALMTDIFRASEAGRTYTVTITDTSGHSREVTGSFNELRDELIIARRNGSTVEATDPLLVLSLKHPSLFKKIKTLFVSEMLGTPILMQTILGKVAIGGLNFVFADMVSAVLVGDYERLSEGRFRMLRYFFW